MTHRTRATFPALEPRVLFGQEHGRTGLWAEGRRDLSSSQSLKTVCPVTVRNTVTNTIRQSACVNSSHNGPSSWAPSQGREWKGTLEIGHMEQGGAEGGQPVQSRATSCTDRSGFPPTLALCPLEVPTDGLHHTDALDEPVPCLMGHLLFTGGALCSSKPKTNFK